MFIYNLFVIKLLKNLNIYLKLYKLCSSSIIFCIFGHIDQLLYMQVIYEYVYMN